eukprot:Tamp_12388.p1 GENE.Tamp_12388~~Tamp_12388.p1  ORF type:complete len:496 (+),score=228.40 Tamp_12388:84-1490(+)
MPVATMAAAAPHQTATFQGIDRNELAYRLVSKMGWEEGKGLGKDNKGIVKHIWTKKRNDQVGLGGEVGNDWGAHSIQTNTYNSLLSKLAVITNDSGSDSDSDADAEAAAAKKRKAAKKGKKDKHGAKKSESGSDSEEETKKKGKKGSKKKPKKEESSDSDSSDDDVSNAASASCDDYGSARKAGRSYAAAAVKEIKEKKVQTNALRFAYKRAHLNKTKDVKAYSSTDLSQILGYSVAPKEEDKALLARDGVKKYGKAGATKEDSSSDDESEEEEKTSKKRKKDAAPEKEKGGIVIGSSKRKPMALPEPSQLKGVLMHMFSHGGFLSGETPKQKEQDWQFDEATQEKIAVDAHNNKVTGKKGLGFDNDRPTKLGKDYTGSKKRFDDSDDEKDKEEGASEEESEEERKARKKAEKKAKKAAAAAAAAAEEEEEAASEKKKKKKKRAKEAEEEQEEVPEKKKKKAKKQKAE